MLDVVAAAAVVVAPPAVVETLGDDITGAAVVGEVDSPPQAATVSAINSRTMSWRITSQR